MSKSQEPSLNIHQVSLVRSANFFVSIGSSIISKEQRAEIEENSPPPHFIELVSQQPVCVAVSSFNVSVCTATRMPINIAKKTKPKTAAKIAPQGEPSS